MTEPSKPAEPPLRTAARALTSDALEALAEIMRNGSSEHARISAAAAILERGHGKAGQTPKPAAEQRRPAAPLVVRWANSSEEATPDPCRNAEPPARS